MQILDQLGSGEGLPTEAIRAATADRTMVAPLLLEAIDRYEPASEVEENGLFIAFHLLGQWREQSAYRPLARFLRRPDVEFILGDATTETSHRIMANVFDGDPRPIYDIIQDSNADEFVRARIFDTLVILVFRGELDRTAVADFLRIRLRRPAASRADRRLGWLSARGRAARVDRTRAAGAGGIPARLHRRDNDELE